MPESQSQENKVRLIGRGLSAYREIPLGILVVVTVLLGLILVLWGALARPADPESSLPDCVAMLEQELQAGQMELEEELYAFDSVELDAFFSRFAKQQEEYREQGLSFYIFQGDSLVAWSDHHVPEAFDLPALAASGPALLLGNAWYIIRERQYRDFRAYGLQLVKYEYDYENRYLQREYQARYALKGKPRISATPSGISLPVLAENGVVLFYLQPGEEVSPSSIEQFLGVVLLLIFTHLLCILLFQGLPIRHSLWRWLAALIILAGLRFWSLEGGWLSQIIPGESSSALLYASSAWSPTLVDFVLNAFLILQVALWARRHVDDTPVKQERVALPVFMFLFLCLSIACLDLIGGVVTHGQLSLELDGSSDFGAYSVMAFIGVISLTLAVFQVARIVAGMWFRTYRGMSSFLLALLMWGAICFAAYALYSGQVYRPIFWTSLLLGFAYILHWLPQRRPTLALTILSFSILAVMAAQTLETRIRIRDKARLETIAQHLLDGQDANTELLFEEQREDLLTDTLLWSLLDRSDLDKDRVIDELREGYFDGFFDRYELRLDVRDKQEAIPSRYGLVRDSLEIGLVRPIDPSLGLSYVLIVAPEYSEKRAFVEFILRIIPESLGFPELLIKKESIIEQELRDYSIARFIDGRLVDKYGDYAYRARVPSFLGRDEGSKGSFEQDGYWHYAFSRGTETYILSIPKKGFMDKVSTFTLIFLGMSLMIGIGRSIRFLLSGEAWPQRDLQGRIQTLVVGVLLTALVLFGVGAYSYIIDQKERSAEQQLEEKVQSVLIELGAKIEDDPDLEDVPRLERYLVKFSNVFFTDIGLYSLDGGLLASSRPEVFSRQLVAPLMPGEAYYRLAKMQESLYLAEENIGGLEYVSAYVPLVRNEGEVIAYLNLPYFARQGELESELATFLIAVINVLVILFMFSILLAVTVSAWITRPLQLLKEHLSDIRLGEPNRPIPYEGSDEIASLVSQYNAKVAELQENAELLARSERESAWREMAKQVAHEIKNPLTPMKLSLQYLQRSFSDRSEDWEERFERSTKMLIEQIDTLSGIATAFSDFAKMPKASRTDFNLHEVLTQVVELFQESSDITLVFKSNLASPQMINADRDQMTRLFTNLVKNALQSIPEGDEGRVEVIFQEKGFQYIIEVKDNGEGIPEERREQIFQPNFTTKSTGTGLGLAMCKNIVENRGGRIWFNTQTGIGTSFYVSFPLLSESPNAESIA